MTVTALCRTTRPPHAPALVDRAGEINAVLNADASLRIASAERVPPAHVKGLRRDGVDDKHWRSTVGGIEQYRAAYGIDSHHALGATEPF